MRMLRVALVLLVLASFIAATVGVSMAATVTPTVKPTAKPTVKPTAKATMKPLGTVTPIKKTGKMIDLQQMKTTVGNVYKNLMKSTKMPAKPGMPGNNTTAKTGVSKSLSGLNAQKPLGQYSPSMTLSTPAMRSIQTPAIMSQMGSLPQLDHIASAPPASLIGNMGI